MSYISTFDPWKNPLCTCPKQYNLNIYTGCGHGCIYCYAKSYIPNFSNPRRKKDLIKKVTKELQNIPSNSVLALCTSSDPYTPPNNIYNDTRDILNLLKNYNLMILLYTKSNQILNDIPILKQLRVAVMITITTLDANLQKQIEPNAPSPMDRFDAVKTLNKEGIPTGVRYDPIFYQLTDKEAPDIVKEAHNSNAQHLLASTFKGRFDSMKIVRALFPNVLNNYKYDSKSKAYYLDQSIRHTILTQVQTECKKYGLPFATCREGFNLNTALSCNGSHLIP